jgi:hypothetical protein
MYHLNYYQLASTKPFEDIFDTTEMSVYKQSKYVIVFGL